MASVQELLLANEAKKSPFISLMEGVAKGYSNAQSGSIERVKNLLAMAEAQRKREAQVQMNAEIQAEMAAQREGQVQSAFKAVPGQQVAVHPVQKFKKEITQDKDGNYSRKFTEIESPAPAPRYSPRNYVDENGQTRTGRWNSLAGEVEQGANDPIGSQPRKPAAPRLSAGDKTRTRNLEGVASALKNGIFFDEGLEQEIVTRKDAVGVAVRAGIDLDNNPDIKALVDKYPDETPEAPKKPGLFGRIKKAVSGGAEPNGQVRRFKTAADIQAANLAEGTIVELNGKQFRVRY